MNNMLLFFIYITFVFLTCKVSGSHYIRELKPARVRR